MSQARLKVVEGLTECPKYIQCHYLERFIRFNKAYLALLPKKDPALHPS